MDINVQEKMCAREQGVRASERQERVMTGEDAGLQELNVRLFYQA